jgi:hypothetical protein
MAEGRESLSKAARMAGYAGRSDTLSKTGKKLLNNPRVSALIAQLMKEALVAPRAPAPRFRYLMGINEILASTTFLARATLDDVLDAEGRFDVEKARNTLGIHALKTIQFHADGSVKSVTLRDKNGSLELMGRHFQLWDDGEDPDTEARRLLEEEAAERKRPAIRVRS